jgi:hypothetical protein
MWVLANTGKGRIKVSRNEILRSVKVYALMESLITFIETKMSEYLNRKKKDHHNPFLPRLFLAEIGYLPQSKKTKKKINLIYSLLFLLFVSSEISLVAPLESACLSSYCIVCLWSSDALNTQQWQYLGTM